MADGVYSEVDVVVVGAGFGGMYMLHRLRGLGMTAKVFEAGSGVGGTWFWNRYPGARVDIQSLEYSFSFDEKLEREWRWSERYAPQAELLDYANHVADRYDLRRDIQLDTRVNAAHFDETANRWTVTTDRGDTVSARHVVMATGCLSIPQAPKFPGLESFKGKWYHTGQWPHEKVDFTGDKPGCALLRFLGRLEPFKADIGTGEVDRLLTLAALGFGNWRSGRHVFTHSLNSSSALEC